MKRVIKCASELHRMTADQILFNLQQLDSKLREHNMIGEIDMYGGAVMCLGLNARTSTHDIDAIFSPKTDIRQLIREVAEEQGLSEDWMNDAVKGFVSEGEEFFRFGEDLFTNLTVFMTTPKYLLAMKCLSCRAEVDSPTELQDIKFLIKYLNLTTVEDVEKLILEYYPASRFLPKTHYVLEEIFSQL